MTTTLSRVIRVIGLSIVLVVGFELTVRLDDWSQFGVPFTSSTQAMTELFVRDANGPHARPNAWFRQYRIDSRGYRSPEISDDSVRRSAVVITAGASETFGLYEAPGKEWPRQLSDSLASRCGSKPTVVFNSAFAGMTLPTVDADMRRRVKQVTPRVVVYYPTPMQYIEGPVPVAGTPDSAFVYTKPSLLRSRAFPRVRDAVKRAVPAPVLDIMRRVSMAKDGSGKTAPKPLPVDRLDVYEADLRKLVGTIRGIGASPLLVAHQNRFSETKSAEAQRWLRAWEKFYPDVTGQQLVEFDSLASIRTEKVAADSSVAFVNPHKELAQFKPSEAFFDFSHYTTRGSTVIAALIATQVTSILSCEKP